ncbi:uncharacterized protein LOC113791603 [Dermatophagoides pteronyssinus]|uniref:uncharacterized protein LOC113791603 n=1 Tax=Dermatophagoides pteronyssinus TaxID=6956 RepID=UPI003F680FA2
MNTIMLLKNILLFCYFIQMIVAENVQDKKSLDRNMIPYKTVYGVPSKCKGTSDHQTTEENYRTCQINAIGKWQIELQHYYTDSWNFCCFVYDVLTCETKVLYECDPGYSDSNDKETRRLFDKSCQPIMANNPCSKSEGRGDDWIWKGIAIGAGVALLLGLIYDCAQFWRKVYNTKLIAKEAYKAEKFQQKYEKEFIRAVYDHEVEFLDKQYFTNAPKQTSENGEAQPNKKQETAKMSKNDLKKINEKINSQIEADSKNNPSFWDDFDKDPDKYKQPTGFKTKAKKYFKRLWPFSNGNSEEQLKREELIRSEARRQYENIRKNRLELDKISTGQESSIEEIKDDPILAKMIPTLNQEHLDVYRETIKNTDFPESGNEDQLKEWSKNFIDTRNKFRNEFDKKFEMTLGGTTIGESDKGSRKNGNWLKSSRHGSKTTEDESTKILRSDSYKDKKAQTPASMIRTESTSKPAESKTTEILSSDSSKVEKPSNLSLIDEQQLEEQRRIMDKKLEEQKRIYEEKLEEKQRYAKERLDEQQRLSEEKIAEQQRIMEEMAIEKRKADDRIAELKTKFFDQVRRNNSLIRKLEKFPTTTDGYSLIAKKAYEDGIRYQYYDLLDEKQNLVNTWDIKERGYINKLNQLEKQSKKNNEANSEYEALKFEYKENQNAFDKQLRELDGKIEKAYDEMEIDIVNKETRICDQIMQFGGTRNNTEKAIINEIKNSGFGEKFKKFFRSKEKKVNQSDLYSLEYRIRPILTNEEMDVIKQAIDESSVKKVYRTSVLQKMLDLQNQAMNDLSKTKEAILFRDDYVKPLMGELLRENNRTIKSDIRAILTDQEKNYLQKMIVTSESENKQYREYILNEIEEIERSIPITENDLNTLRGFIEIFKKRLDDEENKFEYPLSKFRRKLVEGPNPVISAEQEDFLYYEAMIKPRIYDKPVDYYVWYFKELYTTKGKYFYDTAHCRFATINTKENNLLLKNLLSEAISQSAARNRKRRSISNPVPAISMNIAENTAEQSYQQRSMHDSHSTSQSSSTDSFRKRMQRSVNQILLQTATQMSEHQFTDYSQQF